MTLLLPALRFRKMKKTNRSFTYFMKAWRSSQIISHPGHLQTPWPYRWCTLSGVDDLSVFSSIGASSLLKRLGVTTPGRPANKSNNKTHMLALSPHDAPFISLFISDLLLAVWGCCSPLKSFHGLNTSRDPPRPANQIIKRQSSERESSGEDSFTCV